MYISNYTRYIAEFTTASDKSGQKHLLVIIKATYRLPLAGEAVGLMTTQLPLWMADTATGALGLSAPVYECDYVLRKPKCDVLLLGAAYAPYGIAAERVAVGMQVGTLSKAFYVTGKRTWHAGLFGTRPNQAASFTRQEISYDVAFGGYENSPDNPAERAVYLLNPVGVGFQKKMKSSLINNMPMPQTEAPADPITSPKKKYSPMSFGPLGRSWAQRAKYAGTYGARWEDEVFPFLPADFDDRYFQSAPEDQQLSCLTGGETVTLLNLTHPALTPSGRFDFTIPDLTVDVRFYPKRSAAVDVAARADTLLIEPDQQRFSVTWRVSLPIARSSDEVETVEISTPSQRRATAANQSTGAAV
ncbi:DUF2169 family type VI secretion system accessory protein [Massilia genomosp. 1]|uniref:DUF2169 domain-containing protein n=1 Tax=Massilia genomosp. 1 TaxID=2609280 RepID=A0ABX0N2S4_9BURK|nr:DUF2169 domain-containing protein [Massilia genomosp. 1]NHZ66678.1 DUF2169 domain-containing protein [Massilia genomosp. 1]